MKRLPVLLLAFVLACNTNVSPSNTSLVPPTVANDFFAALCAEDAHYLANNVGGSLAVGVSEEYLTDYFAGFSKQCTGFRYLGNFSYDGTSEQYVFVLSYGTDGEMWFILTIEDGLAVGLE
jgi:hypothetical protein